MGCDIHFFTEVRASAASPWITADEWVPDEFSSVPTDKDCKDPVWEGRHYALFAMLADVRNGGGIGGRYYEPICQPRGAPEDACPEVLAELEKWGSDAHGHSWLLFSELLHYNWTRPAPRYKMITLKQYLDWCRWGREQGKGPREEVDDALVVDSPLRANPVPIEVLDAGYWEARHTEGFWQLPADRQVEVLVQSIPGAARLGMALTEGATVTAHSMVRAEWKELYCEIAGEFFHTAIPKLLQIAHAKGGDDYNNVRVVFFFDN